MSPHKILFFQLNIYVDDWLNNSSCGLLTWPASILGCQYQALPNNRAARGCSIFLPWCNCQHFITLLLVLAKSKSALFNAGNRSPLVFSWSLKVIRTIHKLSNWDKSQMFLMYRFGSPLLQCRTCWPVCTVIGLHDQCCSISYADWLLCAVGLVHYTESTWISGAPHTPSRAFYSILLGWFVNKAKDILVASASGVCSTASCPSDSSKWLHVGCTGMKESVRSWVLLYSHVYGFSPWVAVCVYWHTAFL